MHQTLAFVWKSKTCQAATVKSPGATSIMSDISLDHIRGLEFINHLQAWQG